MSGFFLTLEGGEGAGKTSLARALAAALAAGGRETLLTREPGGAPGADEIRALLVSGGVDRWRPLTETLLLTAARHEHLEQVIRPALARGAIVICDRYVDSTRAYQAARGVSDEAIEAAAALIAAEIPDRTLLLDLDPAIGLARSRGAALGEDRFERLGIDLHQRVRARFLALAKAEPARVTVLDARLPADALLAAALAALPAGLAG